MATGEVTIDGAALCNEATYWITVAEFLSTGGDGFTAFAAGTDPIPGPLDIDALVAFFAGDGAISRQVADRIAAVTR